ncbi:CYTH and CHAD domain-containing protein [Colwellia sp. BRX10-3]|uniref:CYTH domain-containing protein n=1 Tax=Colwellia sp. BRX10-3 TaxID=2759844 RepID=UPI0015F701C1|nr:CYTH and CHAD domain-containing protein [Colwellia sp. BRX10-3]MBA6390357.1 CYTH and CHAD domain-containing protein [Colwellia sp. BRX10-3]
MTTEIELKYLVLGDNTVDKITKTFNRKNIHFSYQEKQLANCYFDTPELNLRQHDMGLRVRRNNNHIEQTIKTAGQVVGGLHSRPEYNVDIDCDFPILTLFPNKIWQQGQSVSNIQHDLIVLFNTDFKRCTWLVNDVDGNVVELAFDQGTIASSGKNNIIHELEFELVQGDKSALFNLASLLFKDLALRPGLKSKAARGYALWRTEPIKERAEQQVFICEKSSDSIADAFTYGLSHGLTSLQNNIEQYLTTETLHELVQVKDSLAVIRHGFWLFSEYLTPDELRIRDELSYFVHLLAWVDNAIHLKELTNKTGNYRKKLDFSKQLIKQLKIEKQRFPNSDEICQLLHSSRFNQLQLSILQLYLSRSENKAIENNINDHALIEFAQNKIQFSLSEISAELKKTTNLNCQQYIAQSKLLYRSSLTGTWLAGLFDNDLRDKFRHPWLDLQQGISELKSLWIIQLQLEKLSEPPQKIVQWQHSKVEGLLSALDNTKAIAIAMEPYWLE